MIKDIANDIQNILGQKYQIFINDNSDQITDIKTGDTIESIMMKQRLKYFGIMRKISGGLIALKNIFTTSYAYELTFQAPTGESVLNDLENMILTMNGSLNTVGNYKYVITFNEPIPVGNMEWGTDKDGNAILYQTIRITGDIAVSDKSLFGNDITITVDNNEIKGLISANPTLQTKFEGDKQKGGSAVPILEVDYYTTSVALVLHARSDDSFIVSLIDYVFDSNLISFRANKDSFAVIFNYFGKTALWNNAKITGINFEMTIGGYVIVSVGFVRSEAI